MFTAVIAFLNAIIAVPKIGALVMDFIGALTSWYVQKQTRETQGLIADAAALGARAQTQEDRYVCAEAWQKALSRSRSLAG